MLWSSIRIWKKYILACARRARIEEYIV